MGLIKNIVIVGVAASLIVSILPKGAEKTGGQVRQLAAFVLLCVMLSPFTKFAEYVAAVRGELQSFYRVPEEQQETEDAAEHSDETVCRYIVELLCNKYSFDRDSTSVKLVCCDSDGSMSLDEIQIYTSSEGSDSFSYAEEYLGALFDCEVYVFGVDLEK